MRSPLLRPALRPALRPVVLLAGTALALTACAQSDTSGAVSSSTSSSAAGSAAPAAALPAPFDGDAVQVALVRQSGAGDYFESWGQGAATQAEAVNIELTVTDARNDNAVMATNMQQAISAAPDAIIVDHGQQDTMQPLVEQAVAAGIPVIVYDLALDPVDGVITTSQSDESMAQGVLDQMITDVGDGARVGYVSATGYAALDRRAVVWQDVVAEHSLEQVFSTGEVTDSTATDNIPLVDAALKQDSDVAAIFAPYDEITKGVVQAVQQNGLQDSVKVYGIDISNADIEVMTADGSPWVATSATDPAQVGGAVVRTLALSLAGELEESDVTFPAVTVTQQFLLDNGITSVDQLAAAEPDLVLDDVSVADWLPDAV